MRSASEGTRAGVGPAQVRPERVAITADPVRSPLGAFCDEEGFLLFPEDGAPLALPAQVYDGAVLHRAHVLHGQDRLLHCTSPAALSLGDLVELRLPDEWFVVCAVQRVEPGPCYWLDPIEPLHRISLA